MPLIREMVEIKASPETVFELLTKVSDFTLYTGFIKEIRLITESTYRWTVGVDGITLEWDAVVTECECPKRFAWHSIRGIENQGVYELQATPKGTRVTFFMSYDLKNPLVEAAVAPLAEPLIRRVNAEVLNAVKVRLEHSRADACKDKFEQHS